MLSLTSEKFLTYDFELKARTQEKVPIYSVLFFLLLTKYIHSIHSHYAMYMIKMNSFSKTMLSRRRNRLNRSQSDSKQNEHFQCIPIPLNVRMHNLIPQIMSLKTLTIPLFFSRSRLNITFRQSLFTYYFCVAQNEPNEWLR